MKNNISRLIGLLLLLLAGVAAKAADNRIYIQNVETNAGKTSTLPVWLSNTSDIIAFEFVLTMPDGAKLNTSNHAYTDRQSDHQLVVRSIGGNRYKVMGFSPTNTASLPDSRASCSTLRCRHLRHGRPVTRKGLR